MYNTNPHATAKGTLLRRFIDTAEKWLSEKHATYHDEELYDEVESRYAEKLADLIIGYGEAEQWLSWWKHELMLPPTTAMILVDMILDKTWHAARIELVPIKKKLEEILELEADFPPFLDDFPC